MSHPISDTPQLTVAAVQMTSGSEVEHNLAHACEAVRHAASLGARLVVLPENMGLHTDDEHKLSHAAPLDKHPQLAPLRVLARELALGIVAGSVPEVGPDAAHMYNTSVLIGTQGETVAKYRKIHLFDAAFAASPRLQESRHVAAGSEVVVASLFGWRIGLSICFDLRFPELYRQLTAAGATLLCVPAAFTQHTGKDHWQVLVRARAIENQCFVVAADQFGKCEGGPPTFGKSMIVDAWGTVLASAPERPAVVIATLDANDQARIRRELPVLG